mmetsp:Transcript_68521/g.76642  ORF Transcript_68521/g.76642 Transcript_68521/m.76642 type:complete len:85 (-) Transcript_68521:254-508(-)
MTATTNYERLLMASRVLYQVVTVMGNDNNNDDDNNNNITNLNEAPTNTDGSSTNTSNNNKEKMIKLRYNSTIEKGKLRLGGYHI